MKSLILQAISEAAWAIVPSKLAVIVEVASRHAAGEHLSAEDLAAITAARRQADPVAQGSVAVLPLFGAIVPRASLISDTSGLMSAEQFGRMFRTALADDNVGGIVLDINSPGGAVNGVDELASEIFNARGTKPVVAVANHLAASAAYWIGSAADELVVTPSGEVGSIGVFAMHVDQSEANAREGLKPTFISAGKFKTEGNPHEPLSEEAREAIQARVDDYYLMFVRAVARNRGVSVDEVRGGFGEGRVVGARDAVKLGMADRVATLQDAIAGMSGRRRAAANRTAAEDLDFRQRRARALGD